MQPWRQRITQPAQEYGQKDAGKDNEKYVCCADEQPRYGNDGQSDRRNDQNAMDEFAVRDDVGTAFAVYDLAVVP
jgi:hypothetical protein